MYKIFRIIIVCVITLLLWTPVFCQAEQGPVEMADGMRQSGKIYVVIAVILTILGGLIFYVIRLDRKISRLEKENG